MIVPVAAPKFYLGYYVLLRFSPSFKASKTCQYMFSASELAYAHRQNIDKWYKIFERGMNYPLWRWRVNKASQSITSTQTLESQSIQRFIRSAPTLLNKWLYIFSASLASLTLSLVPLLCYKACCLLFASRTFFNLISQALLSHSKLLIGSPLISYSKSKFESRSFSQQNLSVLSLIFNP